MHQLWKLKKAFVKDIIEELPDDPKPPYNTISSVIRILVNKGYVKYKAYGKTYEYFPLISKKEILFAPITLVTSLRIASMMSLTSPAP